MSNAKQLAEVSEYLVKGGNFFEQGGKNHDMTAVRLAEFNFSKGLAKLKELKLSPEERKGIRSLRNAFEYAIKGSKEFQKGQYDKAGEYIGKSSFYADKYAGAISSRVRDDE